MSKAKSFTQIYFIGGNILCSVETTLAGGSSSLFSYSAAVAAIAAVSLSQIVVAVATTITTAVAAANCNQ